MKATQKLSQDIKKYLKDAQEELDKSLPKSGGWWKAFGKIDVLQGLTAKVVSLEELLKLEAENGKLKRRNASLKAFLLGMILGVSLVYIWQYVFYL